MIKLYFCFIAAALICRSVIGFKFPTKHIISYAVNTNSQTLFHKPSAAASHTQSFKTSPLSLMIGPIDVPLIPAVLLSTGAVFAVFNIDNKVDLTDAGRAQSKKQRRLEREAKGKFLILTQLYIQLELNFQSYH